MIENEIKQPIKVNYPEFNNDWDDVKYQEEIDKLTDETFINAGTIRTIKNIKATLNDDIRRKYNKTNGELKTIVDSLLKIHGLHEDNFDFMNNFSKFMTNKLNDISIDENANKNTVSIKGHLKEVELSVDKLIGYDYLYRTMKELYGQREAKKLSAKMYDFSLALADSSNILLPYCWALDASRLVTEGRDFGVLPSTPAKRVESYIAALNELIHQMSNHLAGAIAVGSFFLDIAHILIYKERVPLKELKENKKTRKRIENCYQQFIHSMHNLSRNGGTESPFTNVSIFDKEKLKALLSEENYYWYFPKKMKVLVDNDLGGEDYKLSYDEYKNFAYEYIYELQKIYVDFFDLGIPTLNGLQYRFPVTTINLSKHLDENNIPYLEQDNELFNYIIKKDISRYNIFTSQGTKVASCCFSGDDSIIKLYNDENEEIIMSIKDFSDIFKTNKYKQLYIDSITKDNKIQKVKVIGVLEKEYNDNLIKITVNNKSIRVTKDHIFRVRDIKTKQIFELKAEDLLKQGIKNYEVQIM